MELKIGAYYNVETRINPKSRRLAKLVMSTSKIIPEYEWLINGSRYPFDFWETDGVIWNHGYKSRTTR